MGSKQLELDLIWRSDANEQISSLGLNYNVISGLVSLTTEQIYQLLDKDIDTAILTAKLYLKQPSQPKVRQNYIS
jgi:hypothetical protein